jgi:hypothetical protein
MLGYEECLHRRYEYESPPRRATMQSRGRPASAGRPAPMATMGGHSELDLKIEEEHKRERERETLMKQVSRLFTQRAGVSVERSAAH